VQTVRTSEELASALADMAGKTAAFVPTMGALHGGHMALVDEAKRRSDKVVASIFVNPTQFAAGEDFGRYPRKEAEDALLLKEHGCDLLWLPAVDDIYPQNFATTVRVSGVSERWEGEARPGHFDGVATVVARLLLLVRPDMALFGEKDFQQLAVIRRMVADLGIGVEIVGVPTVRDADGLALSSRNAYLSAEERKIAGELNVILKAAIAQARTSGDLRAAEASAIEALWAAGFSHVDYVAIRDAETLDHVATLDRPARILAAAKIGKTRLIDNMAL